MIDCVVKNQLVLTRTRFCLAAAAFLALMLANSQIAIAQSQWIWSPRQDVANTNYSDCYFRKKFTLVKPEKSELFIIAGDKFELYINGQLVTKQDSYGTVKKLDVTQHLVPGVNLVAVKVAHYEGKNTGLALRLRVLEAGEKAWRHLCSDGTWKTRQQSQTDWTKTGFVDLGWLKAKEIGKADQINPAAGQKFTDPTVKNSPSAPQPSITAKVSPRDTTSNDIPVSQVAASNSAIQVKQPVAPDAPGESKVIRLGEKASSSNKTSYKLPPKFVIEKVLGENEAGSLIAMAFNEFGKLIISKEGGPLMMADLNEPLGSTKRVRTICDKVNSCQGILPLNGGIYVTGMGPQGLALYHLSDNNRDAVFETIKPILKFKGQLGEHGPHGLALGPDGMIYISIGNASGIVKKPDGNSPYRHAYEADLVPRYEDPGGHAVGVKAPGGTIVRTSLDGSKVQTVAGGIRNAYDLVFDARGDLLVHDSDMESDIGMSWYRPTTIYHAHDGADMGWRSGWAKYPYYYLDQNKPVATTGRGSPAGAVIYQHLAFPAKYHDAVFFADWSEGKILVMRNQPDGSSLQGKAETFLSGKALNVVDLDVGEDGALYFCTGGRGTAGGVYRVKWDGKIPESVLTFKNDMARVIRHPQPTAAWARQNLAKLRVKIGEEWGQAMRGVVLETGNTVKFRSRALDNMILYGPTPDINLLQSLAEDREALIRAKAASICGLIEKPESRKLLNQLIKDTSPRVRRSACESLIRLGAPVAINDLQPMLASLDRAEATVARRMLERIPTAAWKSSLLSTSEIRVFIQGGMSLMVAEPTVDNAYQVLAKASEFMDGYVSDQDFIDLLRVIELALARGHIQPANVPAFVLRMKNEFPSQNGTINRELSRILAYLKATNFEGRLVEYLASATDSQADKTHVAMHLQTVGSVLDPSERLALIAYLEQVRTADGGGSYPRYIEMGIENLVRTMPVAQTKEVLKNAAKWPTAAISVFRQLPRLLDQETISILVTSDQEAANIDDAKTRQMRLGVIAILARSGAPESMEYLRKIWREEVDRRADIAIGLAQQPSGENWAYLVSSLTFLDDKTADEVFGKLVSVNRRPRDAAHYRQVILLGYRLRGNGGMQAARLLEHWAGESITSGSRDWKSSLDQCKTWFQNRWPDEAEIIVKQETPGAKYNVDQILAFVESNKNANAAHGMAIYQKAQCANCHQFGSIGKANGPDLTTVMARFSQRELAESILHPSKAISDQYRSKTILTIDGQTLTGLAIKEAGGDYSVVNQQGERIRVLADDIEDIKDSTVSVMPKGLLDSLSQKEVAELFAFLDQGARERTAANSTTSR